MTFTTTENSTDYISLVKTQRRDWFLAAMFLPVGVRNSVLAIYALDIELEHVHHVVKEEMIGHIRYAWWQENIEVLGKPTVLNHPLLQLLSTANIPPKSLLPIVTAYRESFPEYPAKNEEAVMNAVKDYIIVVPSPAYAGVNLRADIQFNKATTIISNHRKKYGQKNNSWLLMKLLFV